MVGKYNNLIILRIIIEVMIPTIFVIFYVVLYFMQMHWNLAFEYATPEDGSKLSKHSAMRSAEYNKNIPNTCVLRWQPSDIDTSIVSYKRPCLE